MKRSTLNIENRKAYYDYFVQDTIECGVELFGNEVKSIKSGMCNLKNSWAHIVNNEILVIGMQITPWETTNRFDIHKNRDIKLLLHKSEIQKLKNQVEHNGITLIPLKVYEQHGKIKVLLGVCKGKHSYDKRETLKAKEAEREISHKIRYVI